PLSRLPHRVLFRSKRGTPLKQVVQTPVRVWLARAVAAILVFVLPVLFGAFIAAKHDVDLWPRLKNGKYRSSDYEAQFDTYERLIAFPGKQELQCPTQTPTTAVFLVLGQSNSANHEAQRFRSVDNRVQNFFGGKCYRAESPLLGASGDLGESTT